MNPDAAPRPAAAASAPFNIRVDRALTHPQVIALLEEHLAGMRAASPPECVFALDLNGLRRPEITFLTAWRLPADASSTHEKGELVAMGVAWALLGGVVVYGVLKATLGIRLDQEEEYEGADLTIHKISATPDREVSW